MFFGLNANFTYNRFVSLTYAGNLTFDDIPGAQTVVLINVLEDCLDCPNVTPAQFDQFTDDSVIKTLNVPDNGESAGFSNPVAPRLVLFQTATGRKGLIKLTKFISLGEQSYILCDIKVMKEGR